MAGRPDRIAAAVRIFDDDAHAHAAVTVVGRPEHPNARIVHLNDNVGAFGRIKLQGAYACRCRHRVAVQRDHGEPVSRQSERYAHGGAGVQHAEQHLLALAHADGLAVPQHPVSESRRAVHNLQTVIRRRPLAHVLHADPGSFPAAGGQHDLAVISAGIARGRVDDEEAELARIGAARKIGHCHGVAVVPARARWFGGEAVNQRFPGRNDRRTFFACAILNGRDEQAVPVHKVGIAGIVDDLDRDRRAFLETEQWSRHGIVVARGLDDFVRSDFQRDRRDPDGVIGGRCGRLCKARAAGDGCEPCAGCSLEQVAAREARVKGGGEMAQPFRRGSHRLFPF